MGTKEEYERRKIEQAANHDKKLANNWRGWWKNRSDRVALLALLANAILAFATLALFVATYYLVKDARNNAERQLRAYVGISTAAGLYMSPSATTMTLQNFGQTPASEVKVFSNWEFLPFGQNLAPDFSFADKPCNDQGIKPGSATVFPQNPSPTIRPHCKDDIANLQKSERNELSAFYYGYIEYRDIFDKKRQTNFCLMYGRTGSPLCDRHNEVDPDEKAY